MADVRYLSDIDSMKQRIIAEFDDYYTNFDPCTASLLAKMDALAAETAAEPMISRKAAMHGMLARECPVHLFRETPFFFEISSGAAHLKNINLKAAFILSSVLLSWNGCCIHFQVMALASITDLRLHKYFLGKFLHIAISFLLSYAMLPLVFY